MADINYVLDHFAEMVAEIPLNILEKNEDETISTEAKNETISAEAMEKIQKLCVILSVYIKQPSVALTSKFDKFQKLQA